MAKREDIVRRCDHPGCGRPGEFRAPKDRSLSEYWLFCRRHVEEYNRAWNYYSGMSADEIEEDTRADETWRGRTFKFGLSLDALASEGRLDDPLGIYEKYMAGRGTHRSVPLARRLSGDERAALSLFGLSYPFLKSELKARYKALARRHHPDLNGGAKSAEERFKNVAAAYAVLSKL